MIRAAATALSLRLQGLCVGEETDHLQTTICGIGANIWLCTLDWLMETLISKQNWTKESKVSLFNAWINSEQLELSVAHSVFFSLLCYVFLFVVCS